MAHLADDFLGRLRRALQHCVDALLGGQDDRQEIGPTVLLEQPPQVVLGIGRQQPRRRALERSALQILVLTEKQMQGVKDIYDKYIKAAVHQLW